MCVCVCVCGITYKLVESTNFLKSYISFKRNMFEFSYFKVYNQNEY